MPKFCPECGAGAEGAKFCPECGTALDEPAPAEAVRAPAPNPAPPAPAAADEGEREVWSGEPDKVMAPMGVRSAKYVLTTERLRVETGMLRKKGEALDLWRVQDVSVSKGMTQRTRGAGDVKVKSADASTPELVLHWIKDPDGVAETIRQTSRAARKRHGVVTQERF